MAIAFLYSGESRYAENTEKDLVETLRSLFEARGIETEFTLQVVVSWHKDGVSHFVCKHEDSNDCVHACDYTDQEVIVAFRTGTTTKLQFASLIFPEDTDDFIDLGDNEGEDRLHRRIFNILTGELHIRTEEEECDDSLEEEPVSTDESQKKSPKKRVSKRLPGSRQATVYFGPLTQNQAPEGDTPETVIEKTPSVEGDYLQQSRYIIRKKLAELTVLMQVSKDDFTQASQEIIEVERGLGEFKRGMDILQSSSPSPKVREKLTRTVSASILELAEKKKHLEDKKAKAEKVVQDCRKAFAKLKEAFDKLPS